MDFKDYQIRLNSAQDKLDRAVVLKAKYEAKRDNLYKELSKFTNNPEDLDSFRNIVDKANPMMQDQLWNLFFDYRSALEAVKSTEYKIKDLTKVRDNWKSKIEVQETKNSNFEHVPAIIKEFVHNWRLKAFDFIMKAVNEYEHLKSTARNYYEKATDFKYDDKEKYDFLYNKYKEYIEKSKEIAKIQPIVLNLAFSSTKEEKLNSILDREERDRVLELIERVNKYVGTIVDASNLSIGSKNGELNGYIKGTEGNCYVETIGAGGYNIQCYHYRVLVKPIKK